MRALCDSLYPELQGLLRANRVTQRDLARRMRKELGRGCTAYLTDRFTGVRSWTIEDACWILDLFGIPHSEIMSYFAPPAAKQERRTA